MPLDGFANCSHTHTWALSPQQMSLMWEIEVTQTGGRTDLTAFLPCDPG